MPDTFDTIALFIAFPIAALFVFNGVDDLFVDMNYYLRGLWRGRRVTEAQLNSKPQQRIAMLVPAWKEADVIEHMLENTLKTLDYDTTRFDVFVGTYPNDLECQAKVDAVSARVPNVQKVVVPHDGPTSKADCLNWVYQGIKLHEETWEIKYDILLLHDSEDVVHPLELKLHNFYIPDYDFVQTPVLPLEVPWYSLVGGSYIDDFTENHLKDMPVRASLNGLIPSAGVGSGFSRAAFEEIAVKHSAQPFDPTSLTEDYEIGLKFRLAGKRTLFACRTVNRASEVTDKKGEKRMVVREEFIATREYFPRAMKAAIKQRSRWILGIEFQTWEKVGWQGPLPVLYCLWRDRKAMLSHVLSVLGYLVVLYVGARLLIGSLTHHAWSYERLFPRGSILWWMVVCNTALLLWRWTVRFSTVRRAYGFAHGLLSIIRLPFGNVMSFFALLKAARQFVDHKRNGTPLKWASTAHTFPSTDALSTYRKRLGELLVEREGLSMVHLEQALELQKRMAEPLGSILTHGGFIDEEQLTRALAIQWSIPVVDCDAAEIPMELIAKLDESEATRLDALPVGLSDGVATVAVARPLAADEKRKVEQQLGVRVRLACASRESLREAREQAYHPPVRGAGMRPRLGERLRDKGLLRAEDLTLALQEQRRTGEHLAELLLRKQLVSPKDIARVVEGPLSAGFRSIGPNDGDPEALRALGLGACALYTMVPLRVPEDGAHVLASAFPLHPQVLATMAARFGSPLRAVLASSADVRLALHIAEREAWPDGHIGGLDGVDGAELAAAAGVLNLTEGEVRVCVTEAVGAQLAPLDHLVRNKRCSQAQLTQILVSVYRLPEGTRFALGRKSSRAGLAELALEQKVLLVSDQPDSLELAFVRPRPEVARRFAGQHAMLPIAWRIVPPGYGSTWGVRVSRTTVVPGERETTTAAV